MSDAADIAETERDAIVWWLRHTPRPIDEHPLVQRIADDIERMRHHKPAPTPYQSALVQFARDTIKSIADKLGVPVSEIVKDIKGGMK